MAKKIVQGATPGDNVPPNSETRLRAIIDSLADGIVIVDGNGVIRFANPAAGGLFTRSPEDLVGTPLGLACVAGETTEMEIVRRGGGEIVYAELRVVETEWEGETVELVSLRDITDRKYAEERSKQLAHEREARIDAEGASRAKSDFLAIMSHELRTPLNAILGYSELIELGISGVLSDTVRDQIGRIRRSAKHLLGLVNDILDLAKVEAGRLSVANAPAKASDAIATALSLIEPQAQAKNLKVIVTSERDALPAYIGDESRVGQIIVNLLSNAVKCTEAGGTITLSAEVTTTPDPAARLQPRASHIRISVTDTGTGIPADKLRAIFEPFVQADSGHTRAQSGSGLGLTIARRLARAMGGDLTVESEIDVGSSFHLWLPTATTRHPEAAGGSADGPPAPSTTSERGSTDSFPMVAGLGEVGASLLSKVAPLVDLIVDRIRSDAALPMAAGLRTSQVSDHLATLLTGIAGALIAVEEAGGEPSTSLADAVEIQRLVAERHGVQRARLAWTESAVRREFMIVREEIAREVHLSARGGGNLDPGAAAAAANRFIDQAEYFAVRALGNNRAS